MTESAEGGLTRVAFVSDSVPERNGVGAYYADLIAQLDDRGFDSTFLCPGGDLPAGLHIPLPGDVSQNVFLPPPLAFGRAIRRLCPDVIVVATPGPFGILGVRWARKLGVRLIVGFHTDYAAVTDLYSIWLLRVLSRRYFQWADRRLFRHADHVLANSMQMQQRARQLGARNISRVGTLVPRPVLERPVSSIRERLQQILYAGRLAPEKRLHTIIEAAEKLPDIRFAVAGDGPLKDMIEKAAERLPNLDYRGWLSRAQLLEQMDASDALVLPSEFESFGTVALEAMARQRIAVVTETCGIVNWPGLAAHLVRFEIDQPLYRVLEQLRDRPASERRALAAGGCRAARELNDESLVQWIDLLRSGDG